MIDFLMSDVSILLDRPVEGVIFVVVLALWCRFVFETTRRFVHGEE